ncbi:Transmembrane amino acid transporter family protein [Prunus dulcis]|uniref:Transmembrane amino acid transporter family protein n=1 Tax=Prunus dulcis TaxID=3755 RepID=A0A4Y1R1Y3_PRUDU|nr:Transmembrane amino acid transporter family protein [Prunus dulcis]
MVKQENSDEAEAVAHPLLQDLKSLEGQNSSSSEKGASFSGAVFNISTTMIGAGIMSIPATIKVLGIVPGFILILLVALVVEVTVEFLLRYTNSGESSTYAGMVGESFGPWGSIAVQICVIITNLGCLIIYFIIIDSLRHTSAVSILLAVVFVVICSAMAIYALCKGKTQKPRLFPDFAHQVSVFDLFTTIPILVTVHPIRAELGKPSDMRSAARISLVISIIIYFSIGFFGYLLFGDSVMDDILVNFDQSSDSTIGQIINDIVRLSYAVHLLDGHGISTRRDKIIAILVIILAVVTSSIAMSTTLYNSAQS